jgi:hypothetical protein
MYNITILYFLRNGIRNKYIFMKIKYFKILCKEIHTKINTRIINFK